MRRRGRQAGRIAHERPLVCAAPTALGIFSILPSAYESVSPLQEPVLHDVDAGSFCGICVAAKAATCEDSAVAIRALMGGATFCRASDGDLASVERFNFWLVRIECARANV